MNKKLILETPLLLYSTVIINGKWNQINTIYSNLNVENIFRNFSKKILYFSNIFAALFFPFSSIPAIFIFPYDFQPHPKSLPSFSASPLATSSGRNPSSAVCWHRWSRPCACGGGVGWRWPRAAAPSAWILAASLTIGASLSASRCSRRVWMAKL